jgi:hypothetical protein
MALALVPQSLLYARSGVYERYLFPGVFAVAFAAIYLLKMVRESREGGAPPARWYAGWAAVAVVAAAGAWTMRSGELRVVSIATGDKLTLSSVAAWFHFEAGRGLFVLVMAFLLLSVFRFKGSIIKGAGQKTFLALLLVWGVLYNSTLAFDRASGSAFEGLSTGELLASIDRNTGKEDVIAVVADPALNFEAAHSLNLYLTVKMGRTDVYAYPVLTRPSYDSFHSTLIPMFGKSYGEKVIREQGGLVRKARAFVVFPGAEKKFLAATSEWFSPERFVRHANRSGYVLYSSPAQSQSQR